MSDERSRRLDAMTEQDKRDDILTYLLSKPDAHIRLDTKQQMEFWGRAVAALEDAGRIAVEFVDLPEQQCSFYKIRLRKTEGETP